MHVIANTYTDPTLEAEKKKWQLRCINVYLAYLLKRRMRIEESLFRVLNLSARITSDY